MASKLKPEQLTNGFCPNCGSRYLIKTGKVYDKLGAHQRYHCRDCGRYTKSPRLQLELQSENK